MADDSNGGLPFGGKLGGRLASMAFQGRVAAEGALAGHKVNLADTVLHKFFDLVSSEIRPTVAPLLKPLLDNMDPTHPAHSALDFLAHGNGQWQAFLGQAVAGQALSSGLGDLFNAMLAVPIQDALSHMTTSIVTPETAARAVAHGVISQSGGEEIARRGNLPGNHFNIIRDLNRTYLDPSAVLDMMRRGTIDRSAAVFHLRRNGFGDQDIDDLLKLIYFPLQPTDAAEGVLRGVVTHAEGRDEAARSGVHPTDFDKLVEMRGDPLPPQELLFAWRRGLIDEGRVDRGLIQGPLKNEWIDVVKRMRYVPMSVEAAVNGAMKGQVPMDVARTITQQNGLDPAHFDYLVASSGLPPGPEHMLDLWNMGIATEADVDRALVESNVHNRWIPLLKQGRHRRVPEERVRMLYRERLITRERATELIAQWGYPPDITAAIVAREDMDRTQKERDLSETTIKGLYRESIIDRAHALDLLQQLGWDEQEAGWKLELEDLARIRKYREAAIGRIRSGYVARRIDEAEAANLMGEIGVPVAQSRELLDFWDIERATAQRFLTPAQIQKAIKTLLFTPAEGFERLVGMGYDPHDAITLIQEIEPAFRNPGWTP